MSFPTKTRVIWVPGMYICIYFFGYMEVSLANHTTILHIRTSGELIIPAIPFKPPTPPLVVNIREVFFQVVSLPVPKFCQDHTKVPKLLGDGLVWSDCPIETCQKMEMAMKNYYRLCIIYLYTFVFISGMSVLSLQDPPFPSCSKPENRQKKHVFLWKHKAPLSKHHEGVVSQMHQTKKNGQILASKLWNNKNLWKGSWF